MDNTNKFIKKLNFNRLTQEIKRKKKNITTSTNRTCPSSKITT